MVEKKEDKKKEIKKREEINSSLFRLSISFTIKGPVSGSFLLLCNGRQNLYYE